ncbi:MAG: MoaD/ThiS family protein [Phycisphaerae bacterium]|nr:MoaD/ThiS family protein [Phycisphaerae bacterium]
MTVHVLIFGAAASAAGSDRVMVVVGDHPTVDEISAALAEQHPALRFALSAPRLAVNGAFAGRETVVAECDEVALITLVGGG